MHSGIFYLLSRKLLIIEDKKKMPSGYQHAHVAGFQANYVCFVLVGISLL